MSFVACEEQLLPLPLRDRVARPFDAVSAGAGDGAVLVAEAGMMMLMVTLPSNDCEPPDKRRCQPDAHFHQSRDPKSESSLRIRSPY